MVAPSATVLLRKNSCHSTSCSQMNKVNAFGCEHRSFEPVHRRSIRCLSAFQSERPHSSSRKRFSYYLYTNFMDSSGLFCCDKFNKITYSSAHAKHSSVHLFACSFGKHNSRAMNGPQKFSFWLDSFQNTSLEFSIIVRQQHSHSFWSDETRWGIGLMIPCGYWTIAIA